MQKINVTKEELAAFVRDMGDSPINFLEIEEKGCGCLFIQYAKRAFPLFDRIYAGIDTVTVIYDDETTTFHFPIRYSYWCPIDPETNLYNLFVSKFSQLIIPEGL